MKTLVATLIAIVSGVLFLYGVSRVSPNEVGSWILKLSFLLGLPAVFAIQRILGAGSTLGYGEVDDDSPFPVHVLSSIVAFAAWLFGAALALGLAE
jgi:hypothetical protein